MRQNLCYSLKIWPEMMLLFFCFDLYYTGMALTLC